MQPNYESAKECSGAIQNQFGMFDVVVRQCARYPLDTLIAASWIDVYTKRRPWL